LEAAIILISGNQWSDFDSWRFSQTPGNPYSGQDGNSKGSYGERQGRTTNLNKELTLNYTHTFYSDHNVDVLLGASEQFSRWEWTDLSGPGKLLRPSIQKHYQSATLHAGIFGHFAGRCVDRICCTFKL
jgi:hypothetical protein